MGLCGYTNGPVIPDGYGTPNAGGIDKTFNDLQAHATDRTA